MSLSIKFLTFNAFTWPHKYKYIYNKIPSWFPSHLAVIVINSFYAATRCYIVQKYGWLIFKEYSNMFNILDIWLPVCFHKTLS